MYILLGLSSTPPQPHIQQFYSDVWEWYISPWNQEYDF